MENAKTGVEEWSIDAFSGRLRRAMVDRTPYSIQKQTGIAQSLVSKYLKGQSTPGVDKLVLLANTLGVSVAWLAAGVGPVDETPPGLRPVGKEPGRKEGTRRCPVADRWRTAASRGASRPAEALTPEFYAVLAAPLIHHTSAAEERKAVMRLTLEILEAITGNDRDILNRMTEEDLEHLVRIAARLSVITAEIEEGGGKER
ncbi:helix-turn-helix domain-containing protein [Billgrantia endophytica]|uniref:helix-turn-helix domain-containing protein n=1 Tax=Billgrantia endophytica TaxID=2033802 RepID=UPI0013FDD2FD|nr:helix-turn-helix domain-containing protein [Halomonas endophytica]